MSSPTLPAGFTFGAALTNTQQRLGYIINEVESNPLITVGAPTAPFLPQNADRVGLIIVNTSINTAFIAVSQAEVNNVFGILLSPNGGSVTMQVRDDWTLPSRAWWGTASGGSAQMYVLELIGVRALPPNFGPGHP